MTTGEPLIVRGAMKPLPTLTKPLRSVDTATHEPAQALRERTDSCTVPAAGVVGEAMVAFVLAEAYRSKFGGDHIDDVLEAVRAYEERIGWRRSAGAGARARPDRLHGRGQVDGRGRAGRRARRRAHRTATGSSPIASAIRSPRRSNDRTCDGERSFRAAEEELVCELLERRRALATVIALGGGSVLSERVRGRSSHT